MKYPRLLGYPKNYYDFPFSSFPPLFFICLTTWPYLFHIIINKKRVWSVVPWSILFYLIKEKCSMSSTGPFLGICEWSNPNAYPRLREVFQCRVGTDRWNRAPILAVQICFGWPKSVWVILKCKITKTPLQAQIDLGHPKHVWMAKISARHQLSMPARHRRVSPRLKTIINKDKTGDFVILITILALC